jgi:hypothetical protein
LLPSAYIDFVILPSLEVMDNSPLNLSPFTVPICVSPLD